MNIGVRLRMGTVLLLNLLFIESLFMTKRFVGRVHDENASSYVISCDYVHELTKKCV